jgi:hypothetical protein
MAALLLLFVTQTDIGSFTNDWFTGNVPDFIASLAHLRATAVKVLEIDSFEGLSTTWFLH